MDFKYMYLGGGRLDRINWAEDRDKWRAVVNAVMNLCFSMKWGEGRDFWTNCGTVSFSRSIILHLVR
jgi:hypothetical protein